MNESSCLRTLVAVAAMGLGAAVLTGCVVAPVGPYRGGYAYGETVAVAPPPVQAEVVGVAPYPGYLWIGGYWNWVGGRHVWAPGHWEAPRPGYRWAPHRWEQTGRGWHLQQGHWERAAR